MKNYRCLVIDDDDLVSASLRLFLPKQWQINQINQLDNPGLFKTHLFDLVLVDMHLSGNLQIAEGLEAIKEVKALSPYSEVIAMSGNLNLDLMEQGLKAGATQFLAKPLDPKEVNQCLEKIENLIQLHSLQKNTHTAHWVGSSAESLQVLKQIAAISPTQGPVLIEGETGTGKEVVTQLIQQRFSSLPFISVNVSAIPDNLFESELFGHQKGAFTGADQNKLGLIEAAHGGFIYLDEIEALPLNQQAKLLRFLQSGEGRRVGSNQNYYVNCTLIAASNEPLPELVRTQRFREDLYFRIKQNYIFCHPLRDRSQDLEELISFFVQTSASKSQKTFLPQTLALLKTYHFPGNVRELKRIVEQVLISSPLPLIRPQDVLPYLQTLNHPTDHPQPTDFLYNPLTSLDQNMAQAEKSFIVAAIKHTKNLEQAWEYLKISRSSLYKKIKDYQIDVDSLK